MLQKVVSVIQRIGLLSFVGHSRLYVPVQKASWLVITLTMLEAPHRERLQWTVCYLAAFFLTMIV